MPDYCFLKPIYLTFKTTCIYSQDLNQPKVNYEDRTKSFLTPSWECNGTFSIALLENKTFHLYHVTIINQLNDQNLMRYNMVSSILQ